MTVDTIWFTSNYCPTSMEGYNCLVSTVWYQPNQLQLQDQAD